VGEYEKSVSCAQCEWAAHESMAWVRHLKDVAMPERRRRVGLAWRVGNEPGLVIRDAGEREVEVFIE